jgi:hypothetical protein
MAVNILKIFPKIKKWLVFEFFNGVHQRDKMHERRTSPIITATKPASMSSSGGPCIKCIFGVKHDAPLTARGNSQSRGYQLLGLSVKGLLGYFKRASVSSSFLFWSSIFITMCYKCTMMFIMFNIFAVIITKIVKRYGVNSQCHNHCGKV